MRIPTNQPGSSAKAFTFVEVLICLWIVTLIFTGILYAYVQSARRAEWSAYSLAAQAFGMMRMEQIRSCKWDLQAVPQVDQLTTAYFPATNGVLDMPIAGTNGVVATNFTYITVIGTNPPLKKIQVDCVWTYAAMRPWTVFTNTIITYRATDN
ncbi:MAG: hypothetical protein HY301_11975 [Verrucomicrobia bacterium]|nr:hypothetical protein [Verrucomicrobiota bacterium]